MKTIKIIDLIVDIANRKEVPKKIKYRNYVYIYEEYEERYYIGGNPDNYSLFSEISYLSLTSLISFLNDEIEIIEDTPKEDKKIPEKLGLINYCEDQATLLIHHKVDEIIDYLKSKGE